MWVTLLFILLLTVQSFSQIPHPLHFPVQNDSISNTDSFLLGLPDNSMMMFWYNSSMHTIDLSRSTDQGVSWDEYTVVYNTVNQNFVNNDFNAVVLNSGRIILSFKEYIYHEVYSDDNGLTWSDRIDLPTLLTPGQQSLVNNTSLSTLGEENTVFVFTFRSFTDSIGVYLLRSADGINWGSSQIIDPTGRSGNIVSVNSGKDILVYESTDTLETDLVFRTSTDGGYTWSDKQTLLSDGFNNKKPRIVKDNSGVLWLLYYRNDPTAFQNFSQHEIYYIKSTDDGVSWSQPEKFTDYTGEDKLSGLSSWNGLPVVSFISSRDFFYDKKIFQIYFGLPGISTDVSTPPFLFDFSASPPEPGSNEPITFRAFAEDENSLGSVKVIVNIDENVDTLEMADDGMHGDSLSGDNIYGYILQDGISSGYFLNYDFFLADIDGNTAYFRGGVVPDLIFNFYDAYSLITNRLKLPFNSKGVLAEVWDTTGITGMRFDESTVLFCGGFFLSGLDQGDIWTNGVAAATLIEDYLPGPVGSNPGDIHNSIYVVKSTDQPFSASWLKYGYAVEEGADFYDGNNDGIYNPVDLNGNGSWDPDEDRPDFLGDVTAWCVYNDALPSSQRRFNQVSPMGIDVQQTLFAIGNDSNPVNNMIFIRYRIINRGTVSPQFDSVYFGFWDDPDIGSYTDDLVGCDTLFNMGYAYNDGDDDSYGVNPPSISFKILAGPPVYIAGETYADLNGNGQYDDGIDTPLDTAFVNRGEFLGTEAYPGAKNAGLTSIMEFIGGDPLLSEPDNHIQARNVLLGLSRTGQQFDPCNFPYGNVFGIPCDQVNPQYLYSGDPVTNTGWINTVPSDQRMLTNTGPFTLKQNEPVDIWGVYIVGRGNSALGSVTKTKEYAASAQYFYNSNFSQLPTDVKDDSYTPVVLNYQLSQNYPNPFNPATRINYTITKKQLVRLKVFDILGREVAVIVNEEKPAGKYTVEFNGSRLASGVYFYQLKAGNFLETRKMIILK